jgi:hypothetical protein
MDTLARRVAISAGVIIIAAITLAFVLFFVSGKQTLSNITTEDTRRIIAYSITYGPDGIANVTLSYVKADSVQTDLTDSEVHFLDPFGKSMSSVEQQLSTANDGPDSNGLLTDKQKQDLIRNADAYEQYALIRLPAELVVGSQNNANAFRAYSILDPESHCLLRYISNHDPNNNKTEYLLQDICHSDIFRVSDGYSCFGHIAGGKNPVVSGYNGLPRMRVSIDNQGYIVAEKPDGQPSGDGTVGEGRFISSQEIQENNDPSCNQYLRYAR